MALKVIYHGTKEYDQMVKLRYEVMRKPLGLSFSQDELEKEKDDAIIGCCMLTKIDNNCTRLRQMAVQKNKQGKGIGESMIAFAENIARDRGYKRLMMHARDTAIGFYEKYGYKVKGNEFIEVNIKHHVMEKELV